MKKIISLLLLIFNSSAILHTASGSRCKIAALVGIPTIFATTYVCAKPKSKVDLSQAVTIASLDPKNQQHVAQIVALTERYQRMLLAPNEKAKNIVVNHIDFMQKLESKKFKKPGHLKGVSAYVDVIQMKDDPNKIVGFAMGSTEQNRPAAMMKNYLTFNNIKSDMFVYKIAIDEKYQHSGIGSLMMQTLIDKARAQGLDAIVLEIYDENSSMLRLKDKFGFQPIFMSTNLTEPFADGTRSHMVTYVKLLK